MRNRTNTCGITYNERCQVPKPAGVYFLKTSICFPVDCPICMWILICICACVYMCLCMFTYACICVVVYIYMCRCLILILLCMCVFLVLGFFVQTGNSFHMYRNAPGHSNWKWIWFCIIVPLIVKTVISASGFQRIFRICDWLHWLCLVLLAISHPLESEFKWISGYYNEASSFSIFLMLFSVCGNPMYYELILLSSKYSSFIPFY